MALGPLPLLQGCCAARSAPPRPTRSPACSPARSPRSSSLRTQPPLHTHHGWLTKSLNPCGRDLEPTAKASQPSPLSRREPRTCSPPRARRHATPMPRPEAPALLLGSAGRSEQAPTGLVALLLSWPPAQCDGSGAACSQLMPRRTGHGASRQGPSPVFHPVSLSPHPAPLPAPAASSRPGSSPAQHVQLPAFPSTAPLRLRPSPHPSRMPHRVHVPHTLTRASCTSTHLGN